MPEETDESHDADELLIGDPTYWAEHPDQLADALKDATGVDAPITFRQHYVNEEWVHLARLPFEAAGNFILSWFQTSTYPVPRSKRLTLTVEEAAEALGISRAFAYEAIQRNEIPHIRIGKRILVPKAQLQRLLSGGHDLPESLE